MPDEQTPNILRSQVAKAREKKKHERAISKGHHCIRCGHNWMPTGKLRYAQAFVIAGVAVKKGDIIPPAACPRCRSYAWNRQYALHRAEGDRRWKQTGSARTLLPLATQVRGETQPEHVGRTVECGFCGNRGDTLATIDHQSDCQVLVYRKQKADKLEAERLAALQQPQPAPPEPPIPPPPPPMPPPQAKPLGDWMDYGPPLQD